MTDHVEIERTFTTDPRRLFRAWTDPVELAAWFAPTGWTVPAETVTIDPRPGGVWRLTMAEDGGAGRVPIDAQLTEVVPGERLVGKESMDGPDGATEITLAVTFGADPSGAKLVLRQGPFPTEELLAQTAAGWGSSFDKLDTLVNPGER